MAGERKPYNIVKDRKPPHFSRDIEREIFEPTANDIERARRTVNVAGHFVYCRHYHVEPEAEGIACRKHGARPDCRTCYTCPNCGGKLFYEQTTVAEHPVTIIEHSKQCVQCGEYFYAGQEIIRPKAPAPVQQAESPDGTPCCSVEGCRHRAWDRKQHLGKFVCSTHHRQVKTWQRLFKQKKKSEAERPLILDGVKLVENPFYNKKFKKPGV